VRVGTSSGQDRPGPPPGRSWPPPAGRATPAAPAPDTPPPGRTVAHVQAYAHAHRAQDHALPGRHPVPPQRTLPLPGADRAAPRALPYARRDTPGAALLPVLVTHPAWSRVRGGLRPDPAPAPPGCGVRPSGRSGAGGDPCRPTAPVDPRPTAN
jgi:hypothetical protein